MLRRASLAVASALCILAVVPARAGVELPHVLRQSAPDLRLVGTIADAEFARAFFSIWLDPRTREPRLREQLTGQR